MRIVLVSVILSINLLASAKTYYVSTTGKDTNPGTILNPWLTWNYAFNHAIAGDTVYFRGGVYYALESQGNSDGPVGTAANPICFFNYPNEVPILDGINKKTMDYGVSFNNAKYVNIKGLVARNHFQLETSHDLAGFGFTFCNNIRVERCLAHHIGVRGFYFYECDEIDVINCDAYNCIDTLSNGAHGDGYLVWDLHSTNLDTTYRVSFRGCRAWNCADDGWDAETEGLIELDSCWAFISDADFGYGINGFKLGNIDIPSNNLGKRITNCIAAFEPAAGFVTNDNDRPAKRMLIYNNFSYHNEDGFRIFDTNSDDNREESRIFKNNIAYANTNMNVFLAGSATYSHEYNSWDIPLSLSNNDFISLDVSQLSSQRKANGSLPDIAFGKLRTGSSCIDAGTYVGLPYNGLAPDLGWYESGLATPVQPLYLSSAIENSMPARLEITYNIELANIVPPASAFAVMVNSVARSVNSVSITGAKVYLTLSTPVAYGDIVTFSYTKPATNPVQTASGGQAASLGPQNVTNKVSPPSPVYVSSVVENAASSVLEISYNLTLANIIPATSAFSVSVNSVARPVNTVTISGTKLLLALPSPIMYGETVTVAYTKPSTNPLQSVAGGQAATFSPQRVTNNVSPAIPVYQSSAVENASPTIIEITFNLTLTNVIPAPSAFTVSVNSSLRSVNSVTISGTKVLLTLSTPVIYGDIMTVAYTKPATNPLQATSGGQAESFSAKSVTNKIGTVSPLYVSSVVENTTPSILEMTYNLTLANIVPAPSAFTVVINSVAINISRVAVSATKVLLTLSRPVVYGDLVTVAYNVPSTNALQTTAGGQASTISAQAVVNKVNPAQPVYISSVIENTAPAQLEITFSLPLANVVPASSVFIVLVNSIARGVNKVVVSGTKVLLTLANPVVHGDIVTVTYIKPELNPIQTPSGGQAATIRDKAVTNNLNAAIPTYVSASVENSAPAQLDIIYNINLAANTPDPSAFIVRINSVDRNVIGVTVSGNKVLLNLLTQVYYQDIITVSYNKPTVNPLQSLSGGLALSLMEQPVTNKVTAVNAPPVIVVNYPASSYSGFVGEINATGSYDINKDNLTFSWTVPANVPVSSTSGSTIKYLGPIVTSSQKVEFTLKISDGKTTQSRVIPIEILPYKPELEIAEVSNVEASSFQTPYYPYNIIDGNIGTMWSAKGNDQWLNIEFKHSFEIQHIKLAFQPGQKRESYFDILGSTDKKYWEPILTKSASCSFSGDLQTFEFPPSKTGKQFNYIKLVGLGNSSDSWNYISELKVFGYRHRNSAAYESLPVKIYPNPARESVTVKIDGANLVTDLIQLTDLSGTVVLRQEVGPDLKEFNVPLNIKSGAYILQLCSGKITQFTQKLIVLK